MKKTQVVKSQAGRQAGKESYVRYLKVHFFVTIFVFFMCFEHFSVKVVSLFFFQLIRFTSITVVTLYFYEYVMNKRTDHNEVRNLIFYVKGI
jgi:hypothetical protein